MQAAAEDFSRSDQPEAMVVAGGFVPGFAACGAVVEGGVGVGYSGGRAEGVVVAVAVGDALGA